MNNEKIKELSGANMDIDLTTDSSKIDWKQETCPWNKEENTSVHKCCIKNTFICKYFCGIKYLDKVLCSYPYENKEELKRERVINNMATTKEYKNFILEQLRELDNITSKPMMGEYLLYYSNILFGGIYDDRLLVKITDTNKKYHMEESIPYDNAKAMYLVSDVDNIDKLNSIVKDTVDGL